MSFIVSSSKEENSQQRRIKPTSLSPECSKNLIIELSDDEEPCESKIVETLVMENASNEIDSINIVTDEPSNSEINVTTKFDIFILKCVNTLKAHDLDRCLTSKLTIIKKCFLKYQKKGGAVEQLDMKLDNSISKITGTVKDTVLSFLELHNWLKEQYEVLCTKENSLMDHITLINKLEKTLSIIQKRIKKLDETELNFDEDLDSNYLLSAKYKKKAVDIYNKICELRGEDPNFGRIQFCRLDFSRSKHTEINQALNKKYKNITVFPTYRDIDKLIRKCVKTKNINLTETELQYEIRHCFKELGSLIQKKRKLDLLDSHNDYLKINADPACDNLELNRELLEHHNQAQNKYEEIINKFVQLQEDGVDPSGSSDTEENSDVDMTSDSS